jgi:hypothetical protein
VGDIRTDFRDYSRAIGAQDMWQPQRHARRAQAVPDIDVIDRRCFELDDNFIWLSDRRLVRILVEKLLDTAVIMHSHCLQYRLLHSSNGRNKAYRRCQICKTIQRLSLSLAFSERYARPLSETPVNGSELFEARQLKLHEDCFEIVLNREQSGKRLDSN